MPNLPPQNLTLASSASPGDLRGPGPEGRPIGKCGGGGLGGGRALGAAEEASPGRLLEAKAPWGLSGCGLAGAGSPGPIP